MRIRLTLIIGYLFLTTLAQAANNDAYSNGNPKQESPQEVFENFWREAKKVVYPKAREQAFFTEANYRALKQKSQQVSNVYQLATEINRFLDTLNVSHTAFYHDKDIEFHLFRSMFATREINDPKVNHIGLQFVKNRKDYVIREVLDGYPADLAGLRRGDKIKRADGNNFNPMTSFQYHDGESPVRLSIERNGKTFERDVTPVFENPNYSFFQAIKNSKKVVNIAGNQVGYIRLWTGIHAEVLKYFKSTIEQDFQDLDGIILDLRGGYGGAWYDYLDPFYANRENFFSFTIIDKQGKQNTQDAPQQQNSNAFIRPMVVLINEGVRSGKESLAYQFKKSARAKVVGSKTEGAFTAGRGVFNEDQNYFLFIASAELLLDGNPVEGVGISPDITVEYPTNKTLLVDPQYQRAVSEIADLLSTKE